MTTQTIEANYEQTSASRTFTTSDVEEFAELSGDSNPIHLDAEYAAETMFGRRIVHGALVNSLISTALEKIEGKVVYLNQESEFQNPVYHGERVTAVAGVKDRSGNIYTLDTVVAKGNGENVITGEATVLVKDE